MSAWMLQQVVERGGVDRRLVPAKNSTRGSARSRMSRSGSHEQ